MLFIKKKSAVTSYKSGQTTHHKKPKFNVDKFRLPKKGGIPFDRRLTEIT
jgi:hypothetical protein